MERRLELHNIFIDVLGTAGESLSRVYFQPPASVQMKYPCIRYSLSGMDQKHADNSHYCCTKQYEVTVIDSNPDSDIPEKLLSKYLTARFDRAYASDGLYHYVFTIYY